MQLLIGQAFACARQVGQLSLIPRSCALAHVAVPRKTLSVLFNVFARESAGTRSRWALYLAWLAHSVTYVQYEYEGVPHKRRPTLKKVFDVSCSILSLILLRVDHCELIVAVKNNSYFRYTCHKYQTLYRMMTLRQIALVMFEGSASGCLTPTPWRAR